MCHLCLLGKQAPWILVIPSCTIKLSHSYTHSLFTHSLHPMFSILPSTLIRPQMSLPPLFCCCCCLNCPSGCVRLSKQRCTTFPVCSKYLRRVPHPPPRHWSSRTILPLSFLWDPLFSFFLFLPFFWDTPERTVRLTEEPIMKYDIMKKKHHETKSRRHYEAHSGVTEVCPRLWVCM